MKNTRVTIPFVGVLGLGAIALCAYQYDKPRVLAVSEVPIAFWSWRTQAPSDAEVRNAFARTNAKALFLRAGQFDSVNGDVKRIRAVSGVLPNAPELHLVYNGTRKLLSELEQIESGTLAGVVADTYRSDLLRAHKENVEIRGLQLDLDVPTRLLTQYAQVLRGLRELLPPDTALSVTGLPTWADSADVRAVLEAVDFWIPQCYGGQIPTHVSERIPISSPKEVERTIAKVRRLEKPFYAGISAYSYAILYDKNGDLVELRGDIDPSTAAQSKNLELIDKRSFGRSPETAEVRLEYRAKSEEVLDGLIIRPGETLVFDLPTVDSLRASARVVRENAGETLLGICVFRLPTAEDAATLSIPEIVSALTDGPVTVSTHISVEAVADRQLRVSVRNAGSAASPLANDALIIDLDVPSGSVSGASNMSGFTAYQTLCRLPGSTATLPCSGRRANVVRLKASAWKPDTVAAITLSFSEPVLAKIPAFITTRISDSRIARESLGLQIRNRGE